MLYISYKLSNRALSLWMLLAITALMLWSLPSVSAPPTPKLVMYGVVSDVTDGDTVSVDLKLRVKVRFSDIDTPEKSQPRRWKRATDDLIAKAKGQECWIELQLPNSPEQVLGYSWTFERWVGRVGLKTETSSLGEWQRRRGNSK